MTRGSVREIVRIVDKIRRELKDLNVECDVVPETRCVYETLERMNRRNIKLQYLSPTDIWRINIIVPDAELCYQALGKIHQLFKHVSGEFKDFISTPDPNGHKFIHTYVEASGFGRMLIQIRDIEMQKKYHLGIIADIEKNPEWHKENPVWIKAISASIHEKEGINEQELNRIVSAYVKQIVVFNALGEPTEFPFGSTVLDYAATFGEESFLATYGAIKNGQPVTNHALLSDGDSIEKMLTGLDVTPSVNWLDLLITPNAISMLKRFLQVRSDIENIKDAVKVLQQELNRLDFNVEYLLESQLLAHYCEMKNIIQEELIEGIGTGEFNAKQIVDDLAEILENEKAILYSGLNSKQIRKLFKPFYISIFAGEDKSGLLNKITAGLENQGFDIYQDFPVRLDKDNPDFVTIVLGVNVIGGFAGGGLVGDTQRFQVMSIGSEVGKVEKITPETVRHYSLILGRQIGI